MTGETHYDVETLALLAEGLLDDATADRIREHLVSCEDCGGRLADLTSVRAVLAAVPTPPMPADVIARLDHALEAEAERLREPQRATGTDGPSRTAAAGPLGVVRADGTIAVSRRRRSLLGLAAAAAAVVAVGTGIVSSGLLTDGSSKQPPVAGGSVRPSDESTGRSGDKLFGTNEGQENPYLVTDSDENFTSAMLSNKVGGYLAPQSATVEAISSGPDARLLSCIQRVRETTQSRPTRIVRARFEGEPATIMTFSTRDSKIDLWVVGERCSAEETHLLKRASVTW
ncbi:anti-sigma factor family protein [Bailinhaonella thermotolerans]|uniref:anti-sigma factor family protein n=1 Tax=Bailinhaonella thermotolerans TaxID=1070861 RepID=UPI00192A571D|nr:zf-HC2 domain-containing protein [Bailinhaonella thermotolerans]